MKRPDWDNYFLNIAQDVASRTTCFSPAKGAVLTKNNNIISTGYNGAPAQIKDCKYDLGYCIRKEKGYASGEGLHICRGAHAEANAIILAAKNGTQIEGATIYTTHLPCHDCTKLIINAGIKEVVYINDYPGSEAKMWFEEAGVKIRQHKEIKDAK